VFNSLHVSPAVCQFHRQVTGQILKKQNRKAKVDKMCEDFNAFINHTQTHPINGLRTQCGFVTIN